MTRPCALASALLLFTACSSQKPACQRAPGPWALTIAPAPIAIAANSSEPQLTRHAGGAILSWVEHGPTGATLKFAERRATAGWSPVQTAAAGSDWFLSWADVPSVSRLADGTLVAHWLKNVDPLIEAYDLMLATSRDDGRTWATPLTPHHDRTRTQHGFASVFAWPDAARPGFGVIWLDGRDQELNTSDPLGGSMALYQARFDATGKQIAESAVNAKVCECCSTSVAMTSSGPIAAFRDRSDQEVRDIHVSRFENGAWSAPTAVHADNWRIDACPVNGPAIAAEGATVAVAWFAVTKEEGHSYAAFSRDGGRSFGAPIRLDDAASIGHVGIEMLGDGAAAATWVEFTDRRARLRVRRIEASGARSAPVEIAGAGAMHVSGHPRIVRAGSDLLLAWTESTGEGADGAGQQVRAATAAIPSR